PTSFAVGDVHGDGRPDRRAGDHRAEPESEGIRPLSNQVSDSEPHADFLREWYRALSLQAGGEHSSAMTLLVWLLRRTPSASRAGRRTPCLTDTTSPRVGTSPKPSNAPRNQEVAQTRHKMTARPKIRADSLRGTLRRSRFTPS